MVRPRTHARTPPRICACETLAVNARERALHRALTLWHANDNLRALETLEAITVEWPRDLFSAKLAEFLYYVLGQQFMGERFRAHMNRLRPIHADDPDFLAMAAFASELCDDFADAEAGAGRALASEPRNPWAQHALTHVLIRQGRIGEGLAHMEAFRCSPPADGRSIRTTRGTSRCCTSRSSMSPPRWASFMRTSGASPLMS